MGLCCSHCGLAHVHVYAFVHFSVQTSLVEQPPRSTENPGRSGAKIFVSYDRRLVIKSITSEEVALLHQILQPYHAVSYSQHACVLQLCQPTTTYVRTYCTWAVWVKKKLLTIIPVKWCHLHTQQNRANKVPTSGNLTNVRV